eukprot:5136926-Prymnesium_polylepis.1
MTSLRAPRAGPRALSNRHSNGRSRRHRPPLCGAAAAATRGSAHGSCSSRSTCAIASVSIGSGAAA